MAQVIRVDGSEETVQPADGKRFTLAELYALINTNIVQLVWTHSRLPMWIDEEGKLRDKPINRRATELYQYGTYDPIVGDAVVCSLEEGLD